MKLANLIFRTGPFRNHPFIRACVVLLWFVAVVFLASKHVFWRDEVRALSFALQGNNVTEMLQGLHGEGHPALWYLLLRLTSAFLPYELILPAVSLGVAAAAVILLARKSPFSWVLLALFVLGMPALYEYSVMTRNYGISMLLMFVFAASYSRHRDHGILLGALLALLANCNVHSALLGAAFCLFWLTDLYWQKDGLKQGAIKNFWINMAVFAIGVCICAATIFPTFNDAALLESKGNTIAQIGAAMFLPANKYGTLAGVGLVSPSAQPLTAHYASTAALVSAVLLRFLLSLVLVGSILGLIKRPAAMLSALAALLGMSVFFAVIYSGWYRHEALWLMFLVSMYWITGAPRPGIQISRRQAVIRNTGWALLLVLLLIQVAQGVMTADRVAFGSLPESRSRDLAQLISRYPELKSAIIVADPDYLVEALPAYMTNRVYRLREAEFGSIVRFSRRAQQELSLAEVLSSARQLRDSEQQPVVILLRKRLDSSSPAERISEGYGWTFTTTPKDVQSFLAATRRIERFDAACCTDESFDVYVLDR